MGNRFVDTMNDLLTVKPTDLRKTETVIDNLKQLQKALRVITIITKRYNNIEAFLKEYRQKMKSTIDDNTILENLPTITKTIKDNKKGNYYNISEIDNSLKELKIIDTKSDIKKIFNKFKGTKYFTIAKSFLKQYSNEIEYFESDGDLYLHKTLFIDFMYYVNNDLMLHIVRPYLLQLA
jgi:hypothetical protein